MAKGPGPEAEEIRKGDERNETTGKCETEEDPVRGQTCLALMLSQFVVAFSA